MPLIAIVIAWLAKIFSENVVQVIMWKIFIYGLFVITLPLVLKGVFWLIVKVFLDYAGGSSLPSGIHPFTYTFTELGAWLAGKLRLPEILGIYLGALSAKVSLRMLPLPGMRIVR